MEKIIKKKVLTEQSIYYGKISLPKNYEINPLELCKSTFSQLFNNKFIFSRDWDLLNTYIKDHIRLYYSINLNNKDTWSNIYTPNEKTENLMHVDPIDLKNAADFVLLYGVNTVDCFVKIFYDDNRRKGRSWDMQLKDNMFIMFPTTNSYIINNTQKNSLNFVQTILYEYL